MSLRDDLDMMERHSRNGTLREHMEGTGPILGAHDRVSDPSAQPNLDTYDLLRKRGD